MMLMVEYARNAIHSCLQTLWLTLTEGAMEKVKVEIDGKRNFGKCDAEYLGSKIGRLYLR